MQNYESKKARLSKIFGFLSVFLLIPFGIPAIILANMSKSETGGVMNKDAKTGMVLGILALVVGFIMAIIYFSRGGA